ncbi:unnamed protein product, partial [Didymodactylos carnosus]
GLVKYINDRAIEEKQNWLNNSSVNANLQRKLSAFVEKGLEDCVNSKPYPDSTNSSRRYRLEKNENGATSLRVIIPPPKPRENQKKIQEEPRDVLLLTRRNEIDLIVKEGLQHMEETGSLSINQCWKKLKKTTSLVKNVLPLLSILCKEKCLLN